MNSSKYNPIIGLEVHVELKTKSKMFCGCSVDYFGKEPNTHVCPVCLGLPGALPVPNRKAIEWCVMIGLAFNCKIPLFSKFDRKNYFYPDLPKGYQISQYNMPFCVEGNVILNLLQDLHRYRNEIPKQVRNDMKKKIRIRRVHMEEDTGKLLHTTVNGEKVSLIDFNRSGVPLVEIVTEPDFNSATGVVEYLKKLQQIVRYLGVSDADMEKGQMRLEPNISLRICHPELVSGSSFKQNEMPKRVRHDNEKLPPYKVEVKNINSFRFVEKAINYEIERQRKILESGKTPVQETRGWEEKKGITTAQRTKEEAHDYRYFPEPDIPPIRWTKSQITSLKSQMPELPDIKFERFREKYSLSEYYSEILTREKETADNFEEICLIAAGIPTKEIANWIINKKIDLQKILPAELIKKILESKKTETIDTKELNEAVKKVIKSNPKAVNDYKKGNKNVIMFLIGQVMKSFSNKIDLKKVKDAIEKVLQ